MAFAFGFSHASVCSPPVPAPPAPAPPAPAPQVPIQAAFRVYVRPLCVGGLSNIVTNYNYILTDGKCQKTPPNRNNLLDIPFLSFGDNLRSGSKTNHKTCIVHAYSNSDCTGKSAGNTLPAIGISSCAELVAGIKSAKLICK